MYCQADSTLEWCCQLLAYRSTLFGSRSCPAISEPKSASTGRSRVRHIATSLVPRRYGLEVWSRRKLSCQSRKPTPPGAVSPCSSSYQAYRLASPAVVAVVAVLFLLVSSCVCAKAYNLMQVGFVLVPRHFRLEGVPAGGYKGERYRDASRESWTNK